MSKKNPKTISLVLGSGGARGLAHIGIIQELEKAGFEIEAIAGSSIGALVGGAYATGKLGEFEEWARAINRVSILGLIDFHFGTGGLMKGDKIRGVVTDMFGEWNIKDLPIKYTAVTADIVKEKEVWINRGPLVDAMRASISLPLFMSPIRRRKALLVDGGVLNPVPVGPTLNDDTDLTLAVNLGAAPQARRESVTDITGGQGTSETTEGETDSKIAGKIKAFVESVSNANILGRSKGEEVEEMPDMLNVADRTFDVMQNCIARQKLAANPPDYLIEIPRDACGIMDFDRAADMIDMGKEKATAIIAAIRSS